MSAFNSFTYVNSDTLSKLAELQHNISDTQGRPTFSVFGFAPVYDHRLDSTGDAPFTYKFGDKDPLNGNLTKFPSSNIKNQPFSTMVNRLDGILFEDDVYFWRPPGSSSAVTERTYGQDDKYRIIKTSKDYNGIDNASNFIIATGYWECVGVTDTNYNNMISSIKFERNLIGGNNGGVDYLRDDIGSEDANGDWIDTVEGGSDTGSAIKDMPVETLWIYRTTRLNTQPTMGSVLSNIPVRDDFGVVVFNDKIITPRGNTWIWQLTNGTTQVVNDATQVDYDVIEDPTYGDISNPKNVTVPTFSAKSEIDDTLRAWERFENSDSHGNDKTFNSNQFIIDYPTVDTLGRQIDYSKRIVNLELMEAQGFSMFENIRFFSKAYKPEGDIEQTVATYRVQLNDQCGTVRFNKIITYIRLYEKIPQDDGTVKWEWSKELYPFTVSILPEPIIKADYGKPGLDSFELDIQINYGQMIDRISESGTDINIQFDTNITNNFDGWAVLNSPSVSVPNDQSPAEPADISGNNFFGVQWDKRVFSSTDIDNNLYDKPGTYVGDKYKKEFGRINSENKSYIYSDIDLSQKNPDGSYNQKYMFTFLVPYNTTNTVTDGSIIDDPINPGHLIATTDYVIRYVVGSELPGTYQSERLILYVNDGSGTTPVDTPNLSSAIVNRDDMIKSIRRDAKDPNVEDKPTMVSVEWVEIENQYASNNILDFSNNALFYNFDESKQRNYDYSSYFKWMQDNTGAQDPTTEFITIKDEKYDEVTETWNHGPTWMKPTLDLQHKLLGYDKILDTDGDAIRLIASDDYDNYAWWMYGSISDDVQRQQEYKMSSRDYAPSQVPGLELSDTQGNRRVLGFDKIGFGQFRTPWEHIIANRIYGKEQVWAKKLNAGQISLLRRDGVPSYRYGNEQYLYNKVVVANDLYSGLGYKELEWSDIRNSPNGHNPDGAEYDPEYVPNDNTYPVFQAQNYDAETQKDIIDDTLSGLDRMNRMEFAGTLIKHTKLGEYSLLWSKQGENLDTSVDSFLLGLDTRSIFNITRETINPYDNYSMDVNDITAHSGSEFRNLAIGEVSIGGRSYGNFASDVDFDTKQFFNQAVLRLATGTSTYTTNTVKSLGAVSSYAYKFFNWQTTDWQGATGSDQGWYGASMLGYNMEVRNDSVEKNSTYYNARSLYKMINPDIFQFISETDNDGNLIMSRELGAASAITTDGSGIEAVSLFTNTDSDETWDAERLTILKSYMVTKDYATAYDNDSLGAILSSDQTSYSMLFRTTGQTIEEKAFVGLQSQKDTTLDRLVRSTKDIAEGTLISSKFLTGILKMPGAWTYQNKLHTQNSSTFRLGSYSDWTHFTEVDLTDNVNPNHWDVYSNIIANYGDLYQNGRIVFNIEDNIGYDQPFKTLTRDLISAYKHNISEPVLTGDDGDFDYIYNTNYKYYKRFNLAINRKSEDHDDSLDWENVTFDLNIFRSDDVGELDSFYYVKPNSGMTTNNKPASFGFTNHGAFYFNVWNQSATQSFADQDSFAFNLSNNPNHFNRALLITDKTTVFSNHIIPRKMFASDGDTFSNEGLKDGTLSESSIAYFYGIGADDEIPDTANINDTFLEKQQNSGSKLGYIKNSAQFDRMYSSNNYTNAIVYNPAQDYSDFITGNDWNTQGLVKSDFRTKPRGNMYFSYYGFTQGFGEKAEWREKYATNLQSIYNREGNEDTAKSVDIFSDTFPFFDVQYNKNGYSTTPSDINQWTDVSRMRAVASYMNTDIIGNLMPSVANSTDQIDTAKGEYKPAINWNNPGAQYVIPFGYVNRTDTSLYEFNVYGRSHFTLGKEWQSYSSASFNRLTTALLSFAAYETKKDLYFPYMSNNSFEITTEGFLITDFLYEDSQYNSVQTNYKPTLMPMANLEWSTGDVLPEQNTVLRYFDSNHEVYLNDTPDFKTGGDFDNDGQQPYEHSWYGYVFPSAPALGSNAERFSDGYFNRLSVRFAGQHDETFSFENKKFFRQEQPIETEDTPSDLSNRFPQSLFGKDTADSGYIEFINQPHREDPNTFSRFVMEPTGGDAYETASSGSSWKKQIAHSMMWNHSLKLPEGESTYGYNQRMDQINPFQILPQMSFEETTDFDTTRFSLTSRPIVSVSDGQELRWVPTLDLGGFYAGPRNPTNQAMFDTNPDAMNEPYQPTYLYEFRNIYSMDIWASNRLTTQYIEGTWNGNMVGFESDIVPVYSYLDIGNKYYKWRDSYMTTINLIYDSADYSNSLLVQESERQLVFNNITRDSFNGRENDIENNFFMKFGGVKRIHFGAERVGYNKDDYILGEAVSAHQWDYYEYNSFQVDWGWDYIPPTEETYAPENPFEKFKVRFQVMPQMAHDVDGLPYPYPTMDLGGYNETLDNPQFFHTIYQWHVKTGSIGVLGDYDSTGTDNRAITFLNGLAFEGGIRINYNQGGDWLGVDDSKMAHPLFDEASAFADLGFLDGPAMRQAAIDAALELGQSADESDNELWKSDIYNYYDQYSLAMMNRNKVYGVEYGDDVSELSDADWAAYELNGRNKTKGVYGIHMLQGETTSSSSSWAYGGSSQKNYLPIYVAGDMLPTISTRSSSSSYIGWGGAHEHPNSRADYNSSLGAPSNIWKAVWTKNIYISGGINFMQDKSQAVPQATGISGTPEVFMRGYIDADVSKQNNGSHSVVSAKSDSLRMACEYLNWDTNKTNPSSSIDIDSTRVNITTNSIETNGDIKTGQLYMSPHLYRSTTGELGTQVDNAMVSVTHGGGLYESKSIIDHSASSAGDTAKYSVFTHDVDFASLETKYYQTYPSGYSTKLSKLEMNQVYSTDKTIENFIDYEDVNDYQTILRSESASFGGTGGGASEAILKLHNGDISLMGSSHGGDSSGGSYNYKSGIYIDGHTVYMIIEGVKYEGVVSGTQLVFNEV